MILELAIATELHLKLEMLTAQLSYQGSHNICTVFI